MVTNFKMKYNKKSIGFWMKIIECVFSAICFALIVTYGEPIMSAVKTVESERLWFIKLGTLSTASAGSTFLVLVPLLIGYVLQGSKVYDNNIAVFIYFIELICLPSTKNDLDQYLNSF
ncbi:hypothetical protein CHUAL_011306 [Chamberlinius hualienensis]